MNADNQRWRVAQRSGKAFQQLRELRSDRPGKRSPLDAEAEASFKQMYDAFCSSLSTILKPIITPPPATLTRKKRRMTWSRYMTSGSLKMRN